ncbi:MAG: prevent-host-death protein [Candidatus Methylomirabilota bacterium]|nr:MAG: prevent-host-death protein [candidate division NC10 bacterium]
MKTIAARELQKKIKPCLDDAQEDRVIITRRGKPAAVLIGVEGEDWETVILETDPTFWRMIQARRVQPTMTVEELQTRLKSTR